MAQVLVIGEGGREHALADALARSPHVHYLYAAPGNGGTQSVAENVPIASDDLPSLLKFAAERRIDLTVVGPEVPLCAGMVDQFQAAGLAIFGPSKAAARIEGDKAYAKKLMQHALVPTAEARVFDRYEDAHAYVATRDTPQVVKAAGLAAGKGVVVCDDPADALLALERVMVKREFGDAGATVVVEEKLKGPEVSVLALVDGHSIYVLETAQDHKRIGDGDTGPNTGGMGAYSPLPSADGAGTRPSRPTAVMTDALLHQIDREILVPIVSAMENDGAPYRGLLYAGLMLTPGGPKVLEFNCRFGDPEAQAILIRMRSDLFELLDATVHGRLDQTEVRWDARPSVCVVMASGGYPGLYPRGKLIQGVEAAGLVPDVKVYHAGTRLVDGRLITSGGRVFGVTALGDDFASARARAYQAVECIHFEGAQYRKDIAEKAHPIS